MNSINPISGPHTHTTNSVSRVMLKVMLALLPATAFGIYLFGWPALNLFIITVLAALLSEVFCLYLAGKPIKLYVFDGSAILTGWLLAMTLPPWSPWWIGVIGSVFAITMGKHVFGGIGQNIFNPAMLARIMLLVSFPLEMTTWINPYPLNSLMAPDFHQSLQITFFSASPIDAVSGATILGDIRTELSQNHTLSHILSNNTDYAHIVSGFLKGSMGETSSLLILAGGVLLMLQRIISWHIPIAMIGTVALISFIFNLINPDQYTGPWIQILSGGVILGAFFIATDLVTSPNTNKGKLLFGAGCGLLVYIIRTWGGYPEGVAFAIIIMNAVTPLIDYYIRPRIYGYKSKNVPIEYDKNKISSYAKIERK